MFDATLPLIQLFSITVFFNQLARERLRAFTNTDPPVRESYFEGTREHDLSDSRLFEPTSRIKGGFPPQCRTLQ